MFRKKFGNKCAKLKFNNYCIEANNCVCCNFKKSLPSNNSNNTTTTTTIATRNLNAVSSLKGSAYEKTKVILNKKSLKLLRTMSSSSDKFGKMKF
jgi:hypothetical protein